MEPRQLFIEYRISEQSKMVIFALADVQGASVVWKHFFKMRVLLTLSTQAVSLWGMILLFVVLSLHAAQAQETSWDDLSASQKEKIAAAQGDCNTAKAKSEIVFELFDAGETETAVQLANAVKTQYPQCENETGFCELVVGNLAFESGEHVDSIMVHVNRAKQVALQGNDSLLFYHTKILQLGAWAMVGQHDSILANSPSVARYFENINDSAHQIAGIYWEGFSLLSTGKSEAIDLALKGLEMAESIRDTAEIVEFATLLGDIYTGLLRDKTKALEYLKFASKISRLSGNKMGEAYSVPRALDLYCQLRQKDSAKVYFEWTQQLKEQFATGNPQYEIYFLNLMTNYKIITNQLEEAVEMVNRRLECRQLLGDSANMRHELLFLGSLYRQMDNYTEAEKALLLAQDLALEIECSTCMAEITEELMVTYINMGNQTKADSMVDVALSYRDSLYSQQNMDALSRAEVKFETKLKEAQIEQQDAEIAQQKEIASQQRIQNILLLILALVLGTAALLIYRSQQKNKRQKEELQKLDALNKQIFSIISHDFREPLMGFETMIAGFDQFDIQDERLAFYTTDIQNQVTKITNILENLLNWARAELNQDLTAKPTSNISEIAEETVAFFATKIADKKIAFVNKIPKGQTVNIHPDLLRIVLRNIVSNAIKYSFVEGTIELRMNDHEIVVQDAGVGFQKNKNADLLNKPVLSQLGTNYESGFGIGLFITRQLLNRVNWQIEFREPVTKQGTEVVVSYT